MFLVLPVSLLLVLALAIPASGFLIRTFIVFHDCAHGSFVRSKRAYATLGAVLGVLLFMPFAWWRHKHAVHHATNGDLDRRGVGDIQTLTIQEYRARQWWGRIGHLFRTRSSCSGPLGGAGRPRPRPPRMIRAARGVLATDLALAVVLAAWPAARLAERPPGARPAAPHRCRRHLAVHVQQFDTPTGSGTTPELRRAALHGSSYLKLLDPAVLHGHIGSTMHHLSARIPNYNLQLLKGHAISGRCRRCRP